MGSFFCLGIQSLLEGLDIGGVVGISYADDMSFGSSDLHSLELVYDTLSSKLCEVELILRPDKSKLLRRDGDDGEFNVDGVEEVEGLVSCGIPIGPEIFVQEFLSGKYQELVDLLLKILDYRGDFSETSPILECLSLFRNCIQSKVTHLMRLLPPGVMVDTFFGDVWELFMDFIRRLLNVEDECDEFEEIWKLPVMMGGGGLTPVKDIHSYCYLASLSTCINMYGGSGWDVVEDLNQRLNVNRKLLKNQVVQSLQKKLCNEWYGKKWETLMKDVPRRVGARICGGMGKGAHWLFSNGERGRTNQKEILFNLALRFGYHLPFDYQSKFDLHFSDHYEDPSQLLGITNGGGVKGRHNRLEKLLKKVLIRAGYDVILEPWVGVVNKKRKRADLLVQRGDVLRPIYIDVTFVSSSMKSYCKRFNSENLSCAFGSKRNDKLKKYKDEVVKIGGSFLPIVFDAMGRIDDRAMGPLKTLLAGLGSTGLASFWRDLAFELCLMRAWTLRRLLEGYEAFLDARGIVRVRERNDERDSELIVESERDDERVVERG